MRIKCFRFSSSIKIPPKQKAHWTAPREPRLDPAESGPDGPMCLDLLRRRFSAVSGSHNLHSCAFQGKRNAPPVTRLDYFLVHKIILDFLGFWSDIMVVGSS